MEHAWAEAVRADDAPGDCERPQAVVRKFSEIETREVPWLWPGRIAVGKLTLLAGDPGLGKSFVTLDLAARVSTGRPMPGACHAHASVGMPPADVLLVNCEDDPADTVGPRLSAAGADLGRISILEAVRRHGSDGASREESFSLVDHIAALEEALDRLPAPRLLVIDPISGLLAGVDTHRNADVRAVLAPLAALAARRSLAVIAVTHLAKNNQGPAVQRAMGSLAFAAAARAVWMIVRDPQDAARRLMLPPRTTSPTTTAAWPTAWRPAAARRSSSGKRSR